MRRATQRSLQDLCQPVGRLSGPARQDFRSWRYLSLNWALSHIEEGYRLKKENTRVKIEDSAKKHLRNAPHLGELISRPPWQESEEFGKGRSFVASPLGSMAGRLGFEPGFLILESGYGLDCDEDLRKAIIELTGNEFVLGDTHEVVDGVLLWWRDGDSDLVDELVDVLAYLMENGPIWVLTPKAGRPRHVEPSDIQDAAPTAGLSQTSSFAIAPDWSATRMVARRVGKR